jgi:hypothetical protein
MQAVYFIKYFVMKFIEICHANDLIWNRLIISTLLLTQLLELMCFADLMMKLRDCLVREPLKKGQINNECRHNEIFHI